MGVLVHIGNASEMNWIGHYVRRRRGDRDGEGTDGRGGVQQTTCANSATVGLLPCCSVPTEGSRAVNASHELLSSPLGGGTNSCPHLGALGASMLGLLLQSAVTF